MHLGPQRILHSVDLRITFIDHLLVQFYCLHTSRGLLLSRIDSRYIPITQHTSGCRTAGPTPLIIGKPTMPFWTAALLALLATNRNPRICYHMLSYYLKHSEVQTTWACLIRVWYPIPSPGLENHCPRFIERSVYPGDIPNSKVGRNRWTPRTPVKFQRPPRTNPASHSWSNTSPPEPHRDLRNHPEATPEATGISKTTRPEPPERNPHRKLQRTLVWAETPQLNWSYSSPLIIFIHFSH